MAKIVSDRQMKSAQTRSENVFKTLKEEIEPLYKKRLELLENLKYFYAFREHEKIPKVSVQELNEVRAKIMYDLALIDVEVKRITDEMIVNHKKKIDVFKDWQKQQTSYDGFEFGKPIRNDSVSQK